MLYILIGLLQRITFRLFFRHIHIANFNYIPNNKPVVIACNHPGAFMDPGLIGSIMRRPIYYTSRGDVFANPLARWFLTGLNIRPIYRLEEGFENLSKNFQTITDLTEILKNNGIVVIFSEGQSALDRRLRPLRKGTARIFMQIAREHELDIQLFASAITYTHKMNFRKSVLYSISRPLILKDYLTDFIRHPQHGYHTFLKELARRISENFVVVTHPECDELVDRHINYYCNTEKLSFIPVVIYNRKKLNALQDLSSRINTLFINDKICYAKLEENTDAYEAALAENKITDAGMVNNPLGFRDFLWLIPALPFSLAGCYFWGLPFIISKAIADKTVSRVDFYDSVNMNSLAIVYALLTFINNIILAFFIGWWSLLIWIIAPVFGECAFWTYDMLVRQFQVKKARRVKHYASILALRRKMEIGGQPINKYKAQ